jgi:ribosomal protein S12 methylthiotransferase accessory factor YcaO
VEGVVITTVVTVTNLNGATVATKLTNAVNDVQAALNNAGFPVAVFSATTGTAIPTLVPSTSTATTDFNSKGKEWL